jgi:hypothetical protein
MFMTVYNHFIYQLINHFIRNVLNKSWMLIFLSFFFFYLYGMLWLIFIQVSTINWWPCLPIHIIWPNNPCYLKRRVPNVFVSTARGFYLLWNKIINNKKKKKRTVEIRYQSVPLLVERVIPISKSILYQRMNVGWKRKSFWPNDLKVSYICDISLKTN